MDECLSNPCQHGGVCVDAVAGYQCQCPDSWHGAQCQLPADQCLHSPCLNALSCRNLQGEPTCRCQPGYAGSFCEISTLLPIIILTIDYIGILIALTKAVDRNVDDRLNQNTV